MSTLPISNPSKSPSIPAVAHSPRSPATAHFDDPPDADTEDQHEPDDADDEDIPYPEPSSEQTLLPPPNFRPFFTLIEDSTSGEHYHPYVHYVFADDDPVILTAASMRSLGLDDTKYLPHSSAEGEDPHQEHEQMEGETEEPLVESPLPPPIPGVEERYMVIDLAADGRTIVDAQSLSPGWQITDTSIRTAPSFDEDSPDQGYMLRVEGIEIAGKSKNKGKGQAGTDKLSEARDRNQGDIFAALDGLVGDVEGGLAIAAKLVGKRPVQEQEATVDVLGRGEESGVGDS